MKWLRGLITFVRTVVAAPGKLGEALMWGKEITAIVKRVTGQNMAIANPFGGAVTELAWIAQWDTGANDALVNERFEILRLAVRQAGGIVDALKSGIWPAILERSCQRTV